MRERWADQYCLIVVRQLRYALTPEVSRRLCQFCKGVIGLRYGIAPFLTRRNSLPPNPASSEVRTYFCSELVAAAYKSIEYLRRDLSSARYSPGMFSASYNLQLIENELGPEIELVFSPK
uniref:Uncharacterized protein n=1 Tax=Spongospora subterranea TaxID=70186 RepID=A0A0H5QJW9_9EUKA|eukprot:CRZ02390.1 hypothetical protein [Spongospora subterranea]